MVQQKSSSTSVGIPQNRPEASSFSRQQFLSRQRQISSSPKTRTCFCFISRESKFSFISLVNRFFSLTHTCAITQKNCTTHFGSYTFYYSSHEGGCLFCNHLILLTEVQCVIHYNHLICLWKAASLVIPCLVFLLLNFCDKLYLVLVHSEF